MNNSAAYAAPLLPPHDPHHPRNPPHPKHTTTHHGTLPTTTRDQNNYTLHPARHFPLCPTHKKWIKLTTHDIQTLLYQPPDFAGQNIWFHLNHPIEFVYILGVIVSVEVFSGRWGGKKVVVVGVDDGSGGGVIEVKVGVKDMKDTTAAGGGDKKKIRTDGTEGNSEEEGDDEEAPSPLEEDTKPTTLKTTTVETTCPGLVLTSTPKEGYSIHLNGEKLDIGTRIKAKGTLSRFRGVFQVEMRRCFVVGALEEEVGFWEGYARFVGEVLCRPWRLGKEEVEGFERRERERVAAEERREVAKREMVKRRREGEEGGRREKDEKRREKEARKEREREILVREMDGNALDKPGWKPWTVAMTIGAAIGGDGDKLTHRTGIGTAAMDSHQASHQRGRTKPSNVAPDLRKNVLKSNSGDLPGFLRASAIHRPNVEAIPWAHEQRPSKTNNNHQQPLAATNEQTSGSSKGSGQLRLSEMPIAGPHLGERQIARIAAVTAAPHTGPWHHSVQLYDPIHDRGLQPKRPRLEDEDPG